MMTNKEILRTAMEQSAIDANCQAEDFSQRETADMKCGCWKMAIFRSFIGRNGKMRFLRAEKSWMCLGSERMHSDGSF